MNEKRFSEAMSELDGRFVEEALSYKKKAKNRSWLRWGAVAACLCLAAFLFASGVFSPLEEMTVKVYASGTDEEITSAGAAFTTGTISDDGDLTGHPLMFYVEGSGIETVRFSCKNGQMNFMDLTGEREEYELAQNFTVRYGEYEGDYSSLLIDWIPSGMIVELESAEISISDLNEDARRDVVVMEISFADGETTTRALSISLQTDGSFYAAFDEFTILELNELYDFVNRVDSEPAAHDDTHEQSEMTVTFLDADGAEVLPEAGWYDTKKIDGIVVQCVGVASEKVQMLFTPSGTETANEMEFLQTKADEGENKVTITADSLHRDSLMGHLQIIVNFGSSAVKSELYNVIYDPEA